MVNATVDNAPVSIQLNSSQSTTVPTNEVWKVQITLSIDLGRNSADGQIRINGTAVAGTGYTSSFGTSTVVLPETVLTGGDTVSPGGSNPRGLSIQGFVVAS